MTVAPVVNDKILVEVDGYAVYEYFANNITYGPATGALSTGSIQLAIDTLESGKMPKSGGTFTGQVIGQTIDTATANTSLATTTYVHNLANSSWTFTHSITGNAGTVTNGVYTSGSYANPSFIASLSADKLSGGTISSTILGNSTLYVGTSAIALNRGSGTQTLQGVSISGNAGTVGSLSINSANTNATADSLVRTDASGNTIVKTLISSTHEKIAASPTYVMASNSTGSSANVTSYQTSYLSVGYATYAATAGSAPASDVYTWAKAATKPSYTKSEVGLGNVDNTADANKSVSYATTAGSATTATTASFAGLLNPLSGNENYKLGYTADGVRTNAGEWGRVVMRYAPNGQTYGVRVDRADSADSATYAGSAGSATNAGYAVSAGYAGSSGSSYSSTNASYASYAGSAGNAGYAGYAGSAGYASSAGSVGVPAAGGIGSIAYFFCDYGAMYNYQGNNSNPNSYIDYQGGTVDIPGSSLWRVNTFSGSPWVTESNNYGSSALFWYEPYPLNAYIRLAGTQDFGQNFNPSSNRTIPESFSYLGISYIISRPGGTWRSLQPLRKHGFTRGSDENGSDYGYTYKTSSAMFIRIS
jgi:hypothetical protein